LFCSVAKYIFFYQFDRRWSAINLRFSLYNPEKKKILHRKTLKKQKNPFPRTFCFLSPGKSFFLPMKFPFQTLVCTFQTLVCTFQTLQPTFQSLEWKLPIEEKTFFWALAENTLVWKKK
jgi:hypothetical protein